MRQRIGFPLAVFVLAAMPNHSIGCRACSNSGATHCQMDNIRNVIARYRLRFGVIPKTLAMLRDGPDDPQDRQLWTDPMLQEVPSDAWGNDFQFTDFGSHFTIRSAGPDRNFGTADDMVVSDDRSKNSLPIRERRVGYRVVFESLFEFLFINGLAFMLFLGALCFIAIVLQPILLIWQDWCLAKERYRSKSQGEVESSRYHQISRL